MDFGGWSTFLGNNEATKIRTDAENNRPEVDVESWVNFPPSESRAFDGRFKANDVHNGGGSEKSVSLLQLSFSNTFGSLSSRVSSFLSTKAEDTEESKGGTKAGTENLSDEKKMELHFKTSEWFKNHQLLPRNKKRKRSRRSSLDDDHDDDGDNTEELGRVWI